MRAAQGVRHRQGGGGPTRHDSSDAQREAAAALMERLKVFTRSSEIMFFDRRPRFRREQFGLESRELRIENR
jgi:hypothetical protein